MNSLHSIDILFKIVVIAHCMKSLQKESSLNMIGPDGLVNQGYANFIKMVCRTMIQISQRVFTNKIFMYEIIVSNTFFAWNICFLHTFHDKHIFRITGMHIILIHGVFFFGNLQSLDWQGKQEISDFLTNRVLSEFLCTIIHTSEKHLPIPNSPLQHVQMERFLSISSSLPTFQLHLQSGQVVSQVQGWVMRSNDTKNKRCSYTTHTSRNL